MIAAIAANDGLGSGSRTRARYQAVTAAAAVCRICTSFGCSRPAARARASRGWMRERSGTGVPTARRSGRLRLLSACGGPRSSPWVRLRTQAFVRGRLVMKLGLAVVRAVVGLLMFGHGAQKLFGWFGGHGLQGTAGFFDQVGLKPGRRTALAAGASEAGGGALLALGFLTPL